MNNIFKSALFGTMTTVMVLTLTLPACSTGPKYEPAPSAPAPMYAPKPDRN